VDIVAYLSWEAASFLKPEAIDRKAMDPDGYVKVKCIATGSRSER
jgi:1-phosphatidylinositol-3-phosphate 5-kinase